MQESGFYFFGPRIRLDVSRETIPGNGIRMGINALRGRVWRAKPRHTARNCRKKHVFCTSFGVKSACRYLTLVNYRISAENAHQPSAGQVPEPSSLRTFLLPFSPVRWPKANAPTRFRTINEQLKTTMKTTVTGIIVSHSRVAVQRCHRHLSPSSVM